ncbi:MAG: uracil-DNA glycosylase [Polyangiaceae bacterium]|nr:uracil-DNA glycosylase [Polyangiaceae bacterium]MCW5791706.1 uracil-DNA glycosylase [Polyangiaceae bacterium]
MPAPPTHGSPPGPSATWERDRGQSAPLAAVAPLSAPLTEEQLLERRAKLEVLEASIRDCARCPLHEQRKQTVFARGTGSSGICFVGEGPGAEEDRLGAPFVGPAGQLLDRMIASMGLMRDEVYVCNIVKCRPPRNRKPTPEEMRACTPYLTEQLDLIAPRVIVALGATAMEGLFGHSLGITRIRGRWRVYKERIHVMPTFHPAYLLRNPRAKRDVWEDLKMVMKLIAPPADAGAP